MGARSQVRANLDSEARVIVRLSQFCPLLPPRDSPGFIPFQLGLGWREAFQPRAQVYRSWAIIVVGIQNERMI